MSLYADSTYPVQAAVEGAHEATLQSLVAPGHWFSGAERAAIVTEARRARCEAGLQEDDRGHVSEGRHGSEPPDVVRRVARQVAVSTNDLDRSFMEDALAEGLSDAQYVEIVGVVSRTVAIDVFARGIGVPVRALPLVIEGTPSQVRPVTARDEGAWVPTVPGGARGGEEAVRIYGSGNVQAAPFIFRSISLAPDEARGLIKLGGVQYLGISDFMDLSFTLEPTISRTQVELLAARVSALNECFY